MAGLAGLALIWYGYSAWRQCDVRRQESCV